MNGGVKSLDYAYNHRLKRARLWVDAIYDREPTGTSRTNSFTVSLFTFDSERPSDFGFKKGDVITVMKKTDRPMIGVMSLFPDHELLKTN